MATSREPSCAIGLVPSLSGRTDDVHYQEFAGIEPAVVLKVARLTGAAFSGKPRPKAYLSIGEYLRKAGAFKTVNVYYNEIISTHPSVALSDNGDDEDVDELTEGMIDAAKHGHLETLKFLATKTQTDAEEGGLGTCIGERASSLMLHLAAEFGHEAIVRYLVEDLWVDVDAATVRGMTALHYAAKANRTAVIRELSRLGADLEARNDSGQVPAQLTKDRLLRRLFQQYLGGVDSLGGAAPMIDRFVTSTASRVVDYVVIMTVKLAPQLQEESDQLSDVKQASASEMWRFPVVDHVNAPMVDASNLAEICTQNCKGESGPLPSYGTLLTDTSGARSYVWSKLLGVYQSAAQRGRARVITTLTTPGEPSSVVAGEVTARIVMVLARQPYTAAYSAICDHVADIILEEAPKWGSLADWSLDMEHERNAEVKFAVEHYATELPLPLPSRQAKLEVLGRTLEYGDAHASHSSLPHLEASDLEYLMTRLGPDTILLALSCLLQEQSVLILSDRVEDLAPVTSALLGLLFPLRWPHTLIPVLPTSLVHYLEAPVPFLMGMDQGSLDRVAADLSCVTMVNLATNKVVLPIRPITSVTTVMVTVASGDTRGKEPARRASRRDSGTRLLAELPTALRKRAETRLRLCVPLEMAPTSDRRHHQPRASKLYTPGLRVAVADVMVELFGAYQTYRYVEGSQNRFISEAPGDHRKLLEAIFSTQLWRIFRDDVRAEEGDASGGECWEEQAQLFCACVERARHSGRDTSAATAGESNSCQDVLYPSENVEQQLALLSVYPEPDSILEDFEDGDNGDGRGAGDGEISSDAAVKGTSAALARSGRDSREGSSSSGIGSGLAGGAGELSLQEKTDEVLKSISTSFATVTDMFGGKNKTPPPRDGTDTAASGAAEGEGGSSSEHRRGGDAGRGSGGWDRFKPPSVAEMKKRLEGMGMGTADTTAIPETHTSVNVRGADTSKRAGGYPPSPPRRTGEDTAAGTGAGSGSGLAKIGESWRDLRRRSAEAMNGAVTKFRSAIDEGDAAKTDTTARGSRSSSVGGKGSAAPLKARTGDDAFWKPFGDVENEGHGEVGGGVLDEPVPLPTAEEVRRGREVEEATKRVAPSARARLNAYYGGGGST